MITRFQRLLLATQHTAFDAGAERLAIALARHCALPLGVVRPMVSNPEFESLAPELAEQAAEQAAAGMDALRAAAGSAHVSLDVHVRSGEEPWREIVDEAVERKADLLITRRRGKPGFLSNLLVGEMVSQVVKYAPCSVLMVPRAATMWTQGVLAAIDGSPITAHVAEVAAMVATQCDASLTVVCVATDDVPETRAAAEAALARACAAATEAGRTPAVCKILNGRIYESILAAADPAGLIVIGRHGQTALSSSAFGGNVHKVVGHASGPVLVVKP